MSSTPNEDVRFRLQSMLRAGPPSARSQELDDLLTDGCARVLRLETEKLRLGRHISRLAADADDPASAGELRSLWARRLALASELQDIRRLLRRLGGSRPGALA